MREEVLVLPPSAERRNASFCTSKTEEAVFNISRNWEAPDLIRQKAIGDKRNPRSEEEAPTSASASAEKLQKEVLRGENPSTSPSSESKKHQDVAGEGLGKEAIAKLVSLSVNQSQGESLQGAPPLQWGSLKRSRCSRGLILQPRLCSLVNESKAMQVQTAEDPSVIINSSGVACKETSKPKNAVSRKRDHPHSSLTISAQHTEEDCKWDKRLRSSDLGELQRRFSVQGGKRGSFPTSQPTHHQECVPYQSITCSSVEKKASPDRFAAAPTERIEASRKNFTLPKFAIALSRKEKEDDFLIFKGGKLCKRPKRRPRAVEKTLLYCTPGNFLLDVSYARYDVKEKKHARGKPRGLKAMESADTDSE